MVDDDNNYSSEKWIQYCFMTVDQFLCPPLQNLPPAPTNLISVRGSGQIKIISRHIHLSRHSGYITRTHQPPVNGTLTKSISVNKTSASQSMLLFFWKRDNYTLNYQMVCSTDPQWFLISSAYEMKSVYLTNILIVNITNLSM